MKFLPILLLTTTLSSLDHFVDLIPTVCGNKFNQKSSIDLDIRFINNHKNLYFIFNPHIKVFGDKSFINTLGIGIRKESLSSLIGIHAHIDHLHKSNLNYFQFSPAFEWFKKKWSFKLNGYFPRSFSSNPSRQKIIAHNLIDSHFEFGTDDLQFDLNAHYDLTKKRAGLVIHGTLFKKLHLIKLSFGKDPFYGKHAKMAVSLRLFGNKKERPYSPINRNSLIILGKKEIPNPEPDIIIAKNPENTGASEDYCYIPVDPDIPAPDERPWYKRLWDSLFNSENKDCEPSGVADISFDYGSDYKYDPSINNNNADPAWDVSQNTSDGAPASPDTSPHSSTLDSNSQEGGSSSESDMGSPISHVPSSNTLDTNDNGNGHDHPSITIYSDYVVENSDVEQNRN